MVCSSPQRPLPPLLRLAVSAVLVPGLAAPVGGLAQDAGSGAGTPSVFDPIRLPDEPDKAQPAPEPNALAPWWTTNQPPVNLANGPQLGTDIVGILNPGFNAPPPLLAGSTRPGVPKAMRWGPVTAHPHLNYGVAYANGLVAGPNQDDFSFINTVSPGVTLELGQRWMVDYTPSLVFYTDDAFENVVNQFATVRGSASSGDWDFGFGNSFAMTDNPLIETGEQTQQTVNTTQLSANRPITPVLSVDLGVSQALRWSNQFNDTFSWSTLNGINYRLRPNLTVGADVGFGYDLVDPGTDMTNERFLMSVSGLLGDKFNYNFSGGFEVRQFLDTDAEMKVSPILNLALNYVITEKTTVNVYGNRQVTPSYFDDQFSESLAVGAGISQRIFGRFIFSLRGGYRWSDFNSTVNPTDIIQSQDFAFARAAITSRFLGRGTASVYYSWSNNSSNNQFVDLESNQFGLSLGYGW